MRKILFVADDLRPSGPARQLCHLAGALLPRRQVRVCVLGESSPWCDELRAQGVCVDVLNRRHPFFDLRALWELRKLVRGEPPSDVIHAWGHGAAWALLLSGACRPGRLTLSAVLPAASGGASSPALGWLLRSAQRVVAFGQGEAAVYRALGVPPDSLLVVPPGVPLTSDDAPPPARLAGLLPDSARVVLVLGPILRHKGQRDAVWAFDIIGHSFADLHLVLLGDGDDRPRVERFLPTITFPRRVHLPGVVEDVRPWLARAELVWVPTLRPGGEGRYAALEAMAAGKPVVASRLPGLADLIVDGQTGWLVRADDKAEWCHRTRLLLEDGAKRRQMGEAARRHVAETFALSALAERVCRGLEEV